MSFLKKLSTFSNIKRLSNSIYYSKYTSQFNCLKCYLNSIYTKPDILINKSPKNLYSININKLSNICVNNRKKWYKRYSSFPYPLLSITIFGFKIFEDEEDKEPELVMMIKRGILAMQRDQLDMAEQLFHLALKSAQEQQEHKGITYIYDLMANLAYQREEFVKAEKLFKVVMERLLLDETPQDDNAIIEISLKLASIYTNTNEIEKAVTGFQYCIDCQEQKIKKAGENEVDDDTLVLWAMSLDWYARLLIRLKEFKLAKQHFLKAYEMSLKVNGSLHEQRAVLLNDIGSVCSLMEEYNEAIDYLKKAISVAESINSPDTPVFYINLGVLQMERKLFEDATNNCMKGLKLATISENEEVMNEANHCLNTIKLHSKK